MDDPTPDSAGPSLPAAAPTVPGWTRGERIALLIGLAGAAAHLTRFSHPDFAVDDAWISFRVARNLLQHGVLTYNASLPPVEGMTNLLWTLLSVAWVGLLPDVDPLVGARVVAWCCQLGAVAALGAAARRLAWAEGGGAVGAALAVGTTVILCALSGSMAYHASSGLETGLWALLVAAAIGQVAAGRGAPAGGLLAAAFATRPEAAALGPALLVALAVGAGAGRAPPRREALRGLLVFAAGVVAVEAFRWGVYGALLPNTWYAKPATSSGAAEYAWRWISLVGGGGLGLVSLLPVFGRRRLTTLAVVAALSFAGALVTGGDWMPGVRRLTEATLLVYLLAGVGLGVARGWQRAAAAVGAVALAASSVVAVVGTTDSALFPHEVNRRVGVLVASTPGVDSVAITDIGRFGWAFPGEIFDLAGLVDAHIAHRPGAHGRKEWDEAYFRERAPDLVFVTAMDGLTPDRPVVLRVFDLPVVNSMIEHGGYTPWAATPTIDDQWLVLWVRDGVTLPEDRWGARDPGVARAFGVSVP